MGWGWDVCVCLNSVNVLNNGQILIVLTYTLKQYCDKMMLDNSLCMFNHHHHGNNTCSYFKIGVTQ